MAHKCPMDSKSAFPVPCTCHKEKKPMPKKTGPAVVEKPAAPRITTKPCPCGKPWGEHGKNWKCPAAPPSLLEAARAVMAKYDSLGGLYRLEMDTPLENLRAAIKAHEAAAGKS